MGRSRRLGWLGPPWLRRVTMIVRCARMMQLQGCSQVCVAGHGGSPGSRCVPPLLSAHLLRHWCCWRACKVNNKIHLQSDSSE
jgi:hypothetical protein